MQLNQEVDWRVSIRKPSKGEVIKKEEAGLHTICTQCQDPYLEQGKTLPFSWAESGKDPAIPWVWGMGVLGMAMFVNEHKCLFLQRYPHSLPYWFSKHVFYVHVCAVCVHTLPFQTLSQCTWSLSTVSPQHLPIFVHPSVLGLQVYISVPGFVHGCWRSDLGILYFYNKHLTHWTILNLLLLTDVKAGIRFEMVF